jgi:DNA-binding MarR family transcriptional regulator
MAVARRRHLNLDEYFPYLINRVGMALVASFGEDPLGRHDLSIAMWRVLVALSNNGSQRLVDLSGMTTIDVSTLSRMVARLMRLGLVLRMRSKTSEREVAVKLTPKGKALTARLIPIALRFEKAAIAGIPADDLATVKRALRRMHENMATTGRKSR